MGSSKLLPQEMGIVVELAKKNLASFNIKYGSITDSFVEIFDSNGKNVVGRLDMPNMDTRDLYNMDECSRIFANLVADAFKMQGIEIFREELFFCEITVNDEYFWEYKAERHRQLTHFVCGENFFCEGEYLERIDTRGNYEESTLEEFWYDFNHNASIVVELSKLKNISVAHYKGKFWEIHPTYHCNGAYIHTLQFSSRAKFFEALDENENKTLSSFLTPYDIAYYRYTADKKVVEDECNKARKIIEDTAYALARSSGIDCVVNCLFYNLPSETISGVMEELYDLSKKLENEKELGNLFFYAENLSSVLTEKIFDNNLENLTLNSIGTVNFIQKAREVLSSLNGEYSLVLNKDTISIDGVYFKGVWRLVKADCEWDIDWQSLVFDTENAIKNTILQLENYLSKKAS